MYAGCQPGTEPEPVTPQLPDVAVGTGADAGWQGPCPGPAVMTGCMTHGDHAQRGGDPIRADCPVACLRAVLSAKTLNPLLRAYMPPSGTPSTVGDVVELYQKGLLPDVEYLGPRRIGEIEICLILAGLLSGHQHTF